MELQYKLINDKDGLIELEKKWKEIQNHPLNFSVTSSYEWVYDWWTVFCNVDNNIYGYNKQLKVFAIFNENKDLFAILPFVIVTRKIGFLKVKFLEFIGQQWGGVYCDIVVKNGLSLLFQDVKNIIKKECKYDILHFRYLTDKTRFFNGDELKPFSACPEINISKFNCNDEYIKEKYSKRLKQNLRTGSNRAKNNNQKLTEEINAITTENIEDIIRISRTKNFEDDKYSIYDDKNKSMFFRSLYENLDSNVVFIKIDEFPVAYRTNVIFNYNKICLDAAYDRNAPKYELGIKSVDQNIANSFNKELSIHSFGPGVDEYKLKFASTIQLLYYIVLRGNRLLGILIFPLLKLMLEKKYFKSYKKVSDIKFS